MSLVGFKAQNHQQQVLVHGPRSHIDDRGTTPEVFDPLHERFGFTIDVAAAPHNTKLPGMIFPDAYLRPQYTPAEEARQDHEQRLQEQRAERDAWLDEIVPDLEE